jgi:predicted secreted hydrolase
MSYHALNVAGKSWLDTDAATAFVKPEEVRYEPHSLLLNLKQALRLHKLWYCEIWDIL